MLVKDMIDRLKKFNPDDVIWVSYITKEDVKEAFSNAELTDENDELIPTDQFVDDDVFHEISSSIDNDDYLWERFNENFNDTCREVLDRLIKENEENQIDEELWDIQDSQLTKEEANDNTNS